MIDYNFNFDPVWRDFDLLIEGLLLGLQLAVVALLIGTAIGLLCGYARISRHAWLRAVVWGYVEIIRNTPILLLIFFVFFGLPELGIYALDKYASFTFALAIYAGAYLAEVFRAGLSSIPARYLEAAKAIGLRPWQRLRYVVLPQATRRILPPWVNTAVEMVKGSTLLSVIGVVEFLLATQQVISRTYEVIPFYLLAGLVYVALNFTISQLGAALERRFAYIKY